MKLIIFDLDGTLTATMAVDENCFNRGFAELLGVNDLNTIWSDYRYVTDAGVFREAFAQKFGREPDATDCGKFVEYFVELLQGLHVSNRALFAEVAGASDFLNHLKLDSGWAVAIATGCWKQSAEFKIDAAELPLGDIPMAFAEDGPSREAIVGTALRRALAHYGQRNLIE